MLVPRGCVRTIGAGRVAGRAAGKHTAELSRARLSAGTAEFAAGTAKLHADSRNRKCSGADAKFFGADFGFEQFVANDTECRSRKRADRAEHNGDERAAARAGAAGAATAGEAAHHGRDGYL